MVSRIVGVWIVGAAVVATAFVGTRVSSAVAATGQAAQSPGAALCAPPYLGKGTGEGANDPTQFPPTTGEFRIGMLFVEFPDARGVSDPGAIYDRFIPSVVEWYRTVSYGRLQLVVRPVRRWLMLPRPAIEYAAAPEREAVMREALQHAVSSVDSHFDFGGYDALYVVLPTSALGRIGQIGVHVSEVPIEADGTRINLFAWLIADELGTQTKDFDAYVVHETGHLLGLPDLYVTGAASTFHLWDAMAWGSGRRTGGMFAWHRWKLGWLDETQIACLTGRRRVEAVVTPLARSGGVKAIIFRRSNDAYVAEVRQRIAEDSGICRTGVLIYRVLFGAPSGSADVFLLRASSQQLNIATCGHDATAPFGVRRGRVTRVRVGNLRFELLRALPDGSYRIRVLRR